jgi:hypothetical protein
MNGSAGKQIVTRKKMFEILSDYAMKAVMTGFCVVVGISVWFLD